MQQKTGPGKGAPNRCYHATTPTASHRLRRPPLGGQCRPAPAGHPRPTPGSGGTRRLSPRSRQRAGPGQHRRQDDDSGCVCAGGRRLHRRRRCVAHRGDGPHPGRHGQGAIHPPLSRGQALGAFLRSFRWGHVRQLDRVSRELLARAWAAGAGPGDAPFTIDLDSTICETSPLTKVFTRQSARQRVRRLCVPEHRAWAPADSPVAPPDSLPRATPAADIDVRSIRRRRPRTLGRSAARNR